jgi:hypothetical protein
MSSLADLPEIVGFFSYSREDDEAFARKLSALRDAIHRELSAQLGRSKTNFRLWQDQAAIALGKLWESEIKTAVDHRSFSFRSSHREQSIANIANSNSKCFSLAKK